MDKVSVIITVFNKEGFIEKTLESVLNQTFKNIEIIVVDDCSTDQSNKIIKSIIKKKKLKIKFIKNNENQGVSFSRNLGFKESGGQYIAFLDGDDCYSKDFISKCLNKFDRTVDIVHCSWFRVNKFYEVTSLYHAPDYDDYLKELLMGNIFAPSSMLFRRKVIDKSGSFKNGFISEDWEYFTRCAMQGFKFKKLDDFLMYYMDNNSFSRRKSFNTKDKRFFLEIEEIFSNPLLNKKYLYLKDQSILRHRFFLYSDYKKWKYTDLLKYNKIKIYKLLLNVKIQNENIKYFLPFLKDFTFFDFFKISYLLNEALEKKINYFIFYINFLLKKIVNKFFKIV
jgi:glycosyltransferase involved in cell wall biosynthesis